MARTVLFRLCPLWCRSSEGNELSDRNGRVSPVLLGFLQIEASHGDAASLPTFHVAGRALRSVAAGGFQPLQRTSAASETSLAVHRISLIDGLGAGMRVAVIGTGIAGNAAAWTLSRRYPVTVYERELRPGGHSHTVTIDYDGTPLAVDIGFIVYNELNYPDLTALFAHLDVETVESCMSFAVTADAGRFEWKGGGDNWLQTADGLFAQRRNVLSPSYLWMLRDILTFNQQSVDDHAAGRLAGLTLGEYFRRSHFAPRLLTDYLAPMGAAIWSAPASEMLDFPAENFVAFFNNHRLLQYDRPVWRTVKGGSRTLCRENDRGVPRSDAARLRGDLDRADAARRRRP